MTSRRLPLLIAAMMICALCLATNPTNAAFAAQNANSPVAIAPALTNNVALASLNIIAPAAGFSQATDIAGQYRTVTAMTLNSETLTAPISPPAFTAPNATLFITPVPLANAYHRTGTPTWIAISRWTPNAAPPCATFENNVVARPFTANPTALTTASVSPPIVRTVALNTSQLYPIARMTGASGFDTGIAITRNANSNLQIAAAPDIGANSVQAWQNMLEGDSASANPAGMVAMASTSPPSASTSVAANVNQ